jgi:hypothetical protein
MARMLFGGGIADWSFGADDDNAAILQGGVAITFWNQSIGGTQFTDLTTTTGDPIAQITSSTGADGNAVGQIPNFYGPDGVFSMWASANNGPRALMTAVNLGEYLGPTRSLIETHVSAGNVNPHGTTLASLTDVANLAAGTTGQLLGKQANGTWAPVTVAGVSGTVQLTGDQTVSGKKTFENQGEPTTVRLAINAAEGQTMDVLQAWSSAAAGQGGAKVKTTALNNKGELRVSPARSDSVGLVVGAQAGQTAHVMDQTTSGGVVLSWMEPNGAWRAPNLGRTYTFAKAGTLVAGVGTFAVYNDSGVPLTIRSVRATVNTAPTGAAVIVDVNLSGTTIFTTQASRPTIAAGTKTSGKVTSMNVTTIPDGGYLTVDVDQIGSTIAGADLLVQLDVY